MGENALHYAVRGGDKRVVEFLLDKGVSAQKAGNYSSSLALFCVSTYMVQVTMELLERWLSF